MAKEVQTRFPRFAFSITESDTTKFPKPTTVYVGGDGDVAVRPWDNPTVTITFTGMVAGQYVPVQVAQVMTATTATALVGMFD